MWIGSDVGLDTLFDIGRGTKTAGKVEILLFGRQQPSIFARPGNPLGQREVLTN
jgi:hypothetical protein